MNTQILEIEPEELTFIYEPKKRSSCSVRLINNSHKHVAYKVKTTAPRKYSVQPNVGILTPKSICDCTVTMQAPGSAPRDQDCKDKFLIQSTIVRGSTTNKDLSRDMFVKGKDKYIEERKLRVSLITPPHSPIPSPMNGKMKPTYEASILKDELLARAEIVTPEEKIAKDGVLSTMTSGLELNPMEDLESTAKSSEIMTTMDAKLKLASEETMPITNAELSPAKDAKFKPAKDEGLTHTNNTESSPTKVAKLIQPNDEGSKLTKNAESSATKVSKFDSTKDEGFALPKNAESSTIRVSEFDPTKDEGFALPKNAESSATKVSEFHPTKDVGFALPKNAKLTPVKDAELTTTWDDQLIQMKGADLVKDAEKLELVTSIEDMKSKLIELESKLSEAEATISKLTEENRLSQQDSRSLRKEIEWRNKRGAVRVKQGYPLLFVCMVALLSIVLGYRLHSGM